MRPVALKHDERHTQLFELLRQTNQAEGTVARKKCYKIRKISEEELNLLQAAAVRSLQANH